ncbi:hypothetical protein, partial [Hydrogenimonas sp.]
DKPDKSQDTITPQAVRSAHIAFGACAKKAKQLAFSSRALRFNSSRLHHIDSPNQVFSNPSLQYVQKVCILPKVRKRCFQGSI